MRLSDLFDNAGANADRVLGPGPGAGGRIVVESPQLGAIARQFGVDWRPASSADRAVLDRPGKPLRREEVLDAVKTAVMAGGASAECDIELAGFTPPLVPFDADPRPVVSDLDYDANAGRFSAVLSVTGEAMEPLHLRVTGRVDDTVELPVATARLLAGSVLRPDDVRMARVHTAVIRGEVARHATEAVGMQVKRPIAAGQPLGTCRVDAALDGAEGRHRDDAARQPGDRAHRAGSGDGDRRDRRTHPGAQSGVARRGGGRGDRARSGARGTQRVPGEGQCAMNRNARLLAPAMACLLLAGCGSLSRLSEVGRPPAMTPTADPTKDPTWRPVSMPMPAREPTPNEVNALWRSGSRAFFKDQRAAQVGDIVTILVAMNDTANMKNATTTARTSAETGSLAQFFGMQSLLPKTITDPSKILNVGSTNNNGGTGQIQRNEVVTIRLAGVVTQVLPNGNLVVSARQEFRVNSELRELQVTGVIRPQDIASDNTVLHDRMAEARIAYGGRGELTEVQHTRWGQQLMDIVLPF